MDELNLERLWAADTSLPSALPSDVHVACLWCHEALREDRADGAAAGRRWRALGGGYGCQASPDSETNGLPGGTTGLGHHAPDLLFVDGHFVRVFESRLEGPRRWTG